MFGMRRYRIFLLVAALAAVTIYYFTVRGSWDAVEYGQTPYGKIGQDSTVKPVIDDEPVPIPPQTPTHPHPYPIDELADDIKAVTHAVVSSASSVSKAVVKEATISTTSSKSALPTTSGEDLLVQKPDYNADLSDEGSGRLNIDWRPQDGTQPRWKKPQEHFPLSPQKVIGLPTNKPVVLPKVQVVSQKESPAQKKDRISKLNTVKSSFLHAWNGYKKYALPHDEVKPLTKTFADPFMGWGATLVDTLDTLWIMGFEEEFVNATKLVAKIDFKTSVRKDIPLFETVIRYLGGLLGAYDVSDHKYPILLSKAEELAEILMGAFDTPNRMPITFYNWAPSYTSQSHRAGSHVVMAELGSLSVEMTRLAQLTKKPKYYDAIARITDEFEKWQTKTLIPGLWPIKVDASGCKKAEHRGSVTVDESVLPILADPDTDEEEAEEEQEPAFLPILAMKGEVEGANVKRRGLAEEENEQEAKPPGLQLVDQDVLAVECTPQGLAAAPNGKAQVYGIGGQADSTYEYLPKMHALLQGRSTQYERMYRASAKAIKDKLLFRPMIKDTTRDILFAARRDLDPKASVVKKREVITYEVTHLSCFLGGMFGLGAQLFGIKEDLDIARQLTDGCVWAYESMPAGIMPEIASVVPCPDLKPCKWDQRKYHDALDPNLDERIAAVKQWNENQKEIYETSKSLAVKEVALPAYEDPVELIADVTAELNPRFIEELPSKTSKSNFDTREEELADYSSGPIAFVPKIALSHDRYVKARIEEERLPPSYTQIKDRHYGLRPEAIESVFYMYRITGDDIWRQKGWQMFESIQSATQTDIANAGVKDVTSNLGDLQDTMESFWLAETLKYFYLLFDDPDKWSLDSWVLNTEAHFFSITQ